MYVKTGLFECCKTLKMKVELSAETSDITYYFTGCDVPYDYHEAAPNVAA
jgi:hypothetical protein